VREETIQAGHLVEKVVNANVKAGEHPNLWVLITVPVKDGEPTGCHLSSNCPHAEMMRIALLEAAGMIERRQREDSIETSFHRTPENN